MNISKTKQITIIGLLAAVAIVGRYAFQAIPNVQPATMLIIATGVAFGWRMGSTLGIVVALVSGMLTGLGSWTPFQMAAWGLVGFISGFIPRKPVVLTVWAFLSAFIYGFVSSLSMLVFIPLTAMLASYMTGLSFDLYHAIGNVVFMMFAPIIFKIFDNYNN